MDLDPTWVDAILRALRHNQPNVGPSTQQFLDKYSLRQPGTAPGSVVGSPKYYQDLGSPSEQLSDPAFQYQYGQGPKSIAK